MVVIELVKHYTNKGIIPPLYYWRDKTGHEIDVIIDTSEQISPIEIKSGKTYISNWFKNIKYWQKLSKQKNHIFYMLVFKNKKEVTIALF